jgi:hypothetical protein
VESGRYYSIEEWTRWDMSAVTDLSMRLKDITKEKKWSKR